MSAAWRKTRVRRMCFFSFQPVYAVLFLVLSASRPNASQAKLLEENTSNNTLEMFCRDFVCIYFDTLLLVSFERGLQERKRLFHLDVSQLLHQYFLHLLNCLKVAFLYLFVLRWWIFYNVNTNSIWVFNGEMPITPRFVSDVNFYRNTFLFKVVVNAVNIIYFNSQIHSLS